MPASARPTALPPKSSRVNASRRLRFALARIPDVLSRTHSGDVRCVGSDDHPRSPPSACPCKSAVVLRMVTCGQCREEVLEADRLGDEPRENLRKTPGTDCHQRAIMDGVQQGGRSGKRRRNAA